MKIRLRGREFEWMEERDLFAPGSVSATSRVIDYVSLKVETLPDEAPQDGDELVTFIGD